MWTFSLVQFVIHGLSACSPCVALQRMPLFASPPVWHLRRYGSRSPPCTFSEFARPGRPLQPGIAHKVASTGGNYDMKDEDTTLENIGAACIPGSDPERPGKVMQDSFFVFRFQVPTKTPYTCVGVLDGHGVKGHIVSGFLRDQLPIRIRQRVGAIFTKIHDAETSQILAQIDEELCTLGNASADDLGVEGYKDPFCRALVESFHLAHFDARKNKDIPAGRSGTTCVLALIDNDSGRLYTANVGDSSAVLIKSSAGGAGPAAVISLSRATKITIPAELNRIERSEGRIDQSGNVFYGPVGIAMTRALGDAVMLRAGVLPTPEIQVHTLTSHRNCAAFIVLGTDGVFDVLSSEEVANIAEESLQDMGCAKKAAASVAELARTRWLGDLPIETKVDDITCTVIKISNS
uniref:PPM-type phosphatase domain-containing protein n=2 Tax=Odontella aurita TaxID=265563 RepID=A0A7S4JRX4_9STRA|mmetsp:Transcript_52081/g.156278  ORF Transcript_52081/g.156278 Transcript_52081/m.156278 type:complete len:406 (+) Transcript_52081:125-1342(+)